MRHKTAFEITLEYLPALIFVSAVRALPLRLAYAFSSFFAHLSFYIDRRHRERTIQHLLHAGIVADRAAAVRLAKRNFHELSKVGVEVFKMHQLLTPATVREHIRLAGSQKAIELFFTGARTSPAIVVTAHFGNWELGGIGYALLSDRSMLTVMRPFDNPKIGRLVYAQREGYKHRLCPKEGALKSLLGALRQGESVALIADQHALPEEGVVTSFFGHPASTHASPARLHLKTGVPILVAVSHRLDDRFHFEFVCADPIIVEPTDDKEGDVQRVAQLYTTALEALIRRWPEQWMWAHRRWLDLNRSRQV